MIPPLVAFPNIDAFKDALKRTFKQNRIDALRLQEHLELADRLHAAGLPPLVSNRALCLLLGISPRMTYAMIASPEIHWRRFEILKRSGARRQILAPRVFLKTLQTFLLQTVLEKASNHPCAFGFTKGRGAKQNAAVHLRQRHIWTVDIENFFPSITEDRVATAFETFGFPKAMNQLLAQLCSYGHRLPQGAPTSPKLSNMIFYPVDTELSLIAVSEGLTYTRYADDLTFSGEHAATRALKDRVTATLRSAQFRLNPAKTRDAGPTSAKRVTGFVINELLHPDRCTRRNLRAKFHTLLNQNLSAKELHEAQGWASYVSSYDQELGREYLKIVYQARTFLDLKREAKQEIAPILLEDEETNG